MNLLIYNINKYIILMSIAPKPPFIQTYYHIIQCFYHHKALLKEIKK